ncbi:WYL domain-containing protein [soil metagenome]
MRNVIERLINLLALLLTASRPLLADEIRKTIPGYSATSDDAFHRMFERDKDLLRRVGIPIEMRFTDGYQVEKGYVVEPDRYRMKDPGLTDEERAALFLAAQVVRVGGELAAPESILKLGGIRLTGALEPFSADLGAEAETLGTLFEAVTERRVVAFRYRGETRRVAPYGIGHRRGHWYVVGLTRSGQRTYRLDRMEKIELDEDRGSFERPSDFNLRASLDAWDVGQETSDKATVRFDAEVAWWAARQLGGIVGNPHPDGSLTVEVPVSNVGSFLGWVLNFGEQAEVLSPPGLRDAVVNRVKGVA